MGAQAEATLTLSLIDRITGPIKRMSARVQASLAAIGKRLGFDRVTRQIRNVTHAFSGLGKGIARTAKRLSMFTALAGLGGGGLLAVLFSLSKATADVSGQIDKLSEVAGMAPVAFQKWAYAGKAVGVESEKIASILKQVNAKIGTYFQKGTGPLKDFFENIPKRVGKSAKAIQREFRGLSSSDALQLYVNYLEKANLSQEEMTFYMEAMAGDATLLLPLLRKNGEELKRLGVEAGRTGGILGKSAIELGKKFSDSQDAVMSRLDGLKRFVGVQLMPVFIDLANAFNKWYDANAKLIRQKIGEWAKRLRQFFRDLLDPSSELRRKIDELAQTFNDAYKGIKPFVDFLGGPLKTGLALLGIWVLAPAITGVALLALSFIGLTKAIGGVALKGIGLALGGLGSEIDAAKTGVEEAGRRKGGLFGKSFALAARLVIIAGIAAAVAETLQHYDPKGNLGGFTTPVDNFLRDKLNLPAKDTGITPGEIWTGIKNSLPSFGKNSDKDITENRRSQDSASPHRNNAKFGVGAALRISDATRAREVGFGRITENLPGKTKDDIITNQPIIVQPQAQVPAPIENKTVNAPQTVNLNIHTQAMTPGEISAAVRSAMKSANDQHAEGVASSLSD